MFKIQQEVLPKAITLIFFRHMLISVAKFRIFEKKSRHFRPITGFLKSDRSELFHEES